MSDVLGDDDLVARYPFFHDAPIHEDAPGTYAMPEGPAFVQNETLSWIHPISRVIGALLDDGFTLELLTEQPLHRVPAVAVHDQRRRRALLAPRRDATLPLLYSLRARRN